MADVKPGWERVKFGEVVRLVREKCHNPIAAGIERVIGLEHLEPGDLRLRSWAAPSDGTTFTSRVRPGQVLFGKRRAYLRKVAVAEFDAVCSGDIYLFESADPEKLLPALLPFICQTDAFFDHAVGTSAGSLSPRTNWTSLAEYEFALPPRDEQRRLVALATAIQCVQVANDELIGAAQQQRRALASALMDTVPESECKPLRVLASRVGVGIASSAAHAYRSQGVPMIRNTDIECGRINVSSLLFLDPAFDAANASKRIRSGDVVVTRTGVPGVASTVPAELDGAQTFTTLIVTPDHRLLDARFLAAWINGPASQRFILSRKGGGVQQNMNATLLERLPTWCPPLERQREIVAALGTADACYASCVRRRTEAEQLLKSSVHVALSAR